MWDVEYTDEFSEWWDTLTGRQQSAISSVVDMLIQYGVHLSYPYSSSVRGSRHSHMRELRAQSGGNPIRVFYAFDPRRSAILLIGGDKTGDNRFYERLIPIADKLYDDYLEELRREGLL